MSENLTEKYTYGKTTTLVDTDDIGEMTEAIESVDQEVDTHVEEANAKFSEYDSKIASIESEMSNVKKSVSDGKSLVAGAITNKGVETAADATFETMATNIDSITTIESASANMTAAAGDMLADKTAIVAGKVVVGTIPSKAAATITPGTSNQTIAAGQYLAGDQTVKGDANLVAANIAKGKSIFGVTGTYDPMASYTPSGKVESDMCDLSGMTVSSSNYVNGTATMTASKPIICAILYNDDTYVFVWVINVGVFTSYLGGSTGNKEWVSTTATSYKFVGPYGGTVNFTLSSNKRTMTLVATNYYEYRDNLNVRLFY